MSKNKVKHITQRELDELQRTLAPTLKLFELLTMPYDQQLAWMAEKGKGKQTVEEIDATINHAAAVSAQYKSAIVDAMIRVVWAYDQEAFEHQR